MNRPDHGPIKDILRIVNHCSVEEGELNSCNILLRLKINPENKHILCRRLLTYLDSHEELKWPDMNNHTRS